MADLKDVNVNDLTAALMKIADALTSVALAIRGEPRAAQASEAATSGKAKRGPRVHPKVQVSEAMARFVGHDDVNDDMMTRPEVEAAVMNYVRESNLQDPADKRKIIPDERLSELFGHSDPVTVLTLKGAIKHHFISEK